MKGGNRGRQRATGIGSSAQMSLLYYQLHMYRTGFIVQDAILEAMRADSKIWNGTIGTDYVISFPPITTRF